MNGRLKSQSRRGGRRGFAPAVTEPRMSSRCCLDCGQPADLPLVDTFGTLHGFVCMWCDAIRRRKLMGWRRRLKRRLRRVLDL